MKTIVIQIQGQSQDHLSQDQDWNQKLRPQHQEDC